MPYYKKKTYKKTYNKQPAAFTPCPDTYAYHDIDANKQYILNSIKYWHVENYKYIIPNSNVKSGEVNYPGFDKPKIFINGKEYKINNSEQFVNEFGIAMNPDDCNEFKYSICEVK